MLESVGKRIFRVIKEVSNNWCWVEYSKLTLKNVKSWVEYGREVRSEDLCDMILPYFVSVCVRGISTIPYPISILT